jgi:hypothetical protein
VICACLPVLDIKVLTLPTVDVPDLLFLRNLIPILDKGFLYFKIWLPAFKRTNCKERELCKVAEGRRSWERWLSGNAYMVEISETSSHLVLRRDFLNSFRVWMKGFHRKRLSSELMLGWSSVSVAPQTMWSMYLGFGGEAAGVLKLDVMDMVDSVFRQSWLAKLTEMNLLLSVVTVACVLYLL